MNYKYYNNRDSYDNNDNKIIITLMITLII